MESRPTPVCRCFVLCRQIFHDPVRDDYALVSVVHQVFAPHYPLVEHLAVFSRWSNAHGSYAVEVQLRSLDGEVLWRHVGNRPFETHEPLQVWIVPLPSLAVLIPAPGKYEVVMLANGQEVASDILLAHRVNPPAAREL